MRNVGGARVTTVIQAAPTLPYRFSRSGRWTAVCLPHLQPNAAAHTLSLLITCHCSYSLFPQLIHDIFQFPVFLLEERGLWPDS